MGRLVLILGFFAAAAAAQQPATTPPRPDSARPDSALAPVAQPESVTSSGVAAPAGAPTSTAAPTPPVVPSPAVVPTTPASAPPSPAAPPAPAAVPVPPPPPEPTPAQMRFQQGLRTADRGVAQLRDGLLRLENAGRDSVRITHARLRLGGLCGAARGFLSSGRGRMDLTAYDDSIRLKAHHLVVQLDTLMRLAPLCEANAAHQPESVASALELDLKAYDAALRDFRMVTALPTAPAK
jgi:hypothetical protein